MKNIILPTLLAAIISATGALADEVRLRAVAALPSTTDFTKRFEAFVNEVNKAGTGVVQIDIVGGPEAIPPQQQDTALRNGVIDIQSGPAAYYSGTLPVSGALKGATVSAATIRENGAWDHLSDRWAETLNAKLLGWLGGDVQFYIYLRDAPEFTANGDLDLSGRNLRSAPTYRNWFDSLNAENTMLSLSEIYAALERSVVDGFGSPIFASDLGTNKLVHTRVGPGVWQNDVVLMVNMDRWNSLDPEAQTILQSAALKIETDNIAYYTTRIEKENTQQKADGITILDLPGEVGARHIRKAHDIVWGELAASAPESAGASAPTHGPRRLGHRPISPQPDAD